MLSHFDILSTYSKPISIKTLQEVLQHNTVEKTFKSSKGTDYIAQVIPDIKVVSTGNLVEDNGTFKYAIKI